MKAITAKEFWEVLEKAGFSGGEKDYARLLNIISAKCGEDARTMKNAGFMDGANFIAKQGNYIYDYLNARGYYDETILN